MDDDITLAWQGRYRRRRLIFEHRDDGGWMRIEQEKRDGEWRTVGKEVVANVTLETPPAFTREWGVDRYVGP